MKESKKKGKNENNGEKKWRRKIGRKGAGRKR